MSADALYPPRPDLKALSSLPFFTHVPHALLTPIMKDENAIRYYHDGEIILHQGDPTENLFILLHGQARIMADDIFLVARASYDMLGELAFINQATRNATVVAHGTVQTLVLRGSLVECLMAHATFTNNLLHLVAEKLHEATQERAFRFRNELLLFGEFRAHLSPEVA